MWPGYIRRVTSLTATDGQGREPFLGFRNGECVSTRRLSFSGPLHAGKVGNESLLGSEPRNMMPREETVVKLGEQPYSFRMCIRLSGPA
jgi:hypothetical protein